MGGLCEDVISTNTTVKFSRSHFLIACLSIYVLCLIWIFLFLKLMYPCLIVAEIIIIVFVVVNTVVMYSLSLSRSLGQLERRATPFV